MKQASFNTLLVYTCLILLSITIAACFYPFREARIQVICRAFPEQYGSWQYAPAGRMDSEQRWVDDCGDAELFYKAYAMIWDDFGTDTTNWCVVCDQLPECPGEFNSCQ